MATPNLFEIKLPEGDVGSITIDWAGQTGEAMRLSSRDWAAAPGVRLIGAGAGRTHIRCTSWDGITFKVGRHNKIVQLENVTLWAGYSRAALIGTPDKQTPIARNFAFRFIESNLAVAAPAPGTGRPAWGFHLYQADDYFRDVTMDGAQLSEHCYYRHGAARQGSLWERVEVIGAGAEPDKVRSDATETLWAGPNVWCRRKKVRYRNWYQTWSNRGGGASVRQGTAENNSWEQCEFWSGGDLGALPGQIRSRCIMVTAEGNSYDMKGKVDGQAPGNGLVLISQCAAQAGGIGTENYSLLARVGRQAGPKYAAAGLLVDGCGMWGQRMQFQTDSIPAGKTEIRGCNTPSLRAICDGIGMDTRSEVVILTHDRIVPLSEGFKR